MNGGYSGSWCQKVLPNLWMNSSATSSSSSGSIMRYATAVSFSDFFISQRTRLRYSLVCHVKFERTPGANVRPPLPPACTCTYMYMYHFRIRVRARVSANSLGTRTLVPDLSRLLFFGYQHSSHPGVVGACVKAGLPDRPDHPDHQKCGGKKRSSWERVTARSQGSRRLDR